MSMERGTSVGTPIAGSRGLRLADAPDEVDAVRASFAGLPVFAVSWDGPLRFKDDLDFV